MYRTRYFFLPGGISYSWHITVPQSHLPFETLLRDRRDFPETSPSYLSPECSLLPQTEDPGRGRNIFLLALGFVFREHSLLRLRGTLGQAQGQGLRGGLRADGARTSGFPGVPASRSENSAKNKQSRGRGDPEHGDPGGVHRLCVEWAFGSPRPQLSWLSVFARVACHLEKPNSSHLQTSRDTQITIIRGQISFLIFPGIRFFLSRKMR